VDDTVTVPASTASAAPAFGPPVEPGEVGCLDPYRVVKELGRGGMGAVYAAIDTRLERRLALKVMLPQFAADPAAKTRFLREARAAARIKHDNVVTVYEADERDGTPYIAMEFLEGYSLDEYLRRAPSRSRRSCALPRRLPPGWARPTGSAWFIATSSPPTCGWRRPTAGSRCSTSGWPGRWTPRPN
jgi:serine/threonine protein kinase